jgi:hypothetical protein
MAPVRLEQEVKPELNPMVAGALDMLLLIDQKVTAEAVLKIVTGTEGTICVGVG